MALKVDVAANMTGRIFQLVLALLVVPFYLKLLGSEAYGLIGFFISLQVLISIFDLGFSGALCRELAQSQNKKNSFEILKTSEFVYLTIALFVCFLFSLLHSYLALSWIQTDNISIETLKNSLSLMIIALCIHWPTNLYISGLVGLEKHITVNILLILNGLVKSLGAVFVLSWVEASIELFFLWQIAAATLQLVVTRFCLFFNLNKTFFIFPVFYLDAFKKIWSYAGGLSITSIVTLLLLQVDKVLLSTLMPLSQFGFYVLASTVV
jgi:O-antigen/teichoic acid export membrane protein